MLCLIALFACTKPAERTLVRVQVEADPAVRDLADEVRIVVETQYPNRGGWVTATSERFEPKVMDGFPLEVLVDSGAPKLNYLVTASARDDRGSIVAEARALRDAEDFNRRNIFLRFEATCVRRMTLCPKGETCHAGDCLDAHYDYETSRSDPAQPSEPADAGDAGPDPGGPTVANEGATCGPDGARSCTEEGSRTPLECSQGSWHSIAMCGDNELCDMTPGAQRGKCRQIANECRGQAPNVPFCDREIMRVCASSFDSEMRPCGTNEHCVASAEARCECMIGFVKGATGCERPSDCRVANGGCDSLTACTMRGSERVCGECPPGYLGTGESGCEPLLADLTPSAGQLVPAFEPNIHSYRIKASLLTQRLTLTANAPSAERLELNGAAVASGRDWTTPTLPLGEYPVKLTLTSKSGATSDYEVIIERRGAQAAYLKASNIGSSDEFGVGIAMSGDTLVVGAYGEDSAATKIDGDQASNGAGDAGAAYVFVRRGEHWEQQAYLKASDAAPGDYFGANVAIEGDTIVVGAMRMHLSGRNSSDRPGGAYVFTRSGQRWTQVARLSSADSTTLDMFGTGVAIQGDTIAVGAPADAGDGSVFVFTRAGDWKQQAKIKAVPSMDGARFGLDVALSNDTLLIGAPMDSRPLDGVGSAYVYVRNGADWQLQQRLTPDPPSMGASFGLTVAVRGDRALLGAPRVASLRNALVTTTPGEVYAYERVGGRWTQTQRFRSSSPNVNDGFGSSIALQDDAALIGAANEASGGRGVGADASRRDAGYAGSGYLYALESGRWKLSAYLKASNTEAYDSFGLGVALSGDTAVVSANWESSESNSDPENNGANRSGAVYVFE